MCRTQNTSKTKVLIAVTALSCGLSATNYLNPYQEEQRKRTAHTSYTQKPAQFGTKKNEGNTFLREFDLFIKVLLSGPFGLYHGWRTRKHR